MEPRNLAAGLSVVALFLLIALLAGLVIRQIDQATLDQIYALSFTT